MIGTLSADGKADVLYRQVADRLRALVREGAFRPGDRVPSVRQMSRRLQVSVTTVVDAYRLLEDQGVLHARPQSGFYVRAKLPYAPAEPEISKPETKPYEYESEDLMLHIMRDVGNGRLIHFSSSVPDPEQLPLAKMSQLMSSIARTQRNKIAAYDALPGCRAYREQVAQHAFVMGCVLSPSEIVATSGCQEALQLCLRAVTKPGDAVAVESPTYYGLLQVLQMLGLKAVEIASCPRTGICLDSLERQINHQAANGTPIKACVFMTNYNNPLGSELSVEDKKALVKLLESHEIPLIEDDVYGDLTFSEERPIVAKAFDETGNVMLCSSFSKTLGPGYRAGWCAPGRYQVQFEKLKFANTICGAPLPLLAVAEFLATGGYDRHLRRMRKTNALRSLLVTEAIAEHFPAGTKVTRPLGGQALWVELPEQINTVNQYFRAAESGVTFAPGPIFSAQGAYQNYLRINCSRWNDRYAAGLAKLGEIFRNAAKA